MADLVSGANGEFSGNFPLVSVVVTTKNEEQNIRTCLQSIRAQSWSNIEIIVVDNSSTDKTSEIAREFTPHFYTLGPERSAQRNFGMIEKSRGVYVMYVDADMILSPILLEACVACMHKTGAVGLHVSATILGVTYFSRVRRFERQFYEGTSIDGARFFHRGTFIQAGGFDEDLFTRGSGEDWDIDKLIKRIGKIELLPRSFEFSRGVMPDWTLKNFVEVRGVAWDTRYAGIYHNESHVKLFSYLKKKAYYGLGFQGYIDKWGKSDPDVSRQFGVRYRFWRVFTEDGKWRKFFYRPDLALGIYFLRFCVGLTYLWRKVGLHSSRDQTL